jgi:hypothetical protein
MDFLRNLLRYLFPALIVVLGLLLLLGSSDQSSVYKIAGFAIVVSGLLAGLMVANILSDRLNIILQFVVLIAAAYFVYQDYNSVDAEIRYARKKAKINAEVIDRLKDVRTAQLTFKQKYGRYTASIDTLVNFVKNDSLPEIRAVGEIPDTLSEGEALELGIISRDTFYVSVIDVKYNDPRILEKRGENYSFDPDLMVIAPFSKKPFVLQAGFIDVSGLQKPVYEAKYTEPFAEPALKVGSMTEANTNGNWKE